MSHNDQTKTTVPDPIDLIYGPAPGAVRVAVPTAHTAPRPPRKTREEKGMELFQAGAVKLPDLPAAVILERLRFGTLRVEVESQTSPGAFHSTNGTCTCQDFTKNADTNPKHLCKHRIALKLAVLDRMEQEARQAREEYENELLACIPRFVIPRYPAPSKRDRLEDQKEQWEAENCCRNEIVHFYGQYPNSEIVRERVEHC